MEADEKIVIVTINCKNKKYKKSKHELYRSCDVLIWQQTWLLDCNLSYLNSVSKDFSTKGTSTIKTQDGVLKASWGYMYVDKTPWKQL